MHNEFGIFGIIILLVLVFYGIILIMLPFAVFAINNKLQTANELLAKILEKSP